LFLCFRIRVYHRNVPIGRRYVDGKEACFSDRHNFMPCETWSIDFLKAAGKLMGEDAILSAPSDFDQAAAVPEETQSCAVSSLFVVINILGWFAAIGGM
jgi:hypothetical protein